MFYPINSLVGARKVVNFDFFLNLCQIYIFKIFNTKDSKSVSLASVVVESITLN